MKNSRKLAESIVKITKNMIDFKLLSARKELFARITEVKFVEFWKIVGKVRPLETLISKCTK